MAALLVVAGCSPVGSHVGHDASGSADAAPGEGDANPRDANQSDSGAGDASTAQLPAVGVYEVAVDGTGFKLLFDAGTRAVTHVRRQATSEWMTGTRYSVDADGNGLALELEDPYGAYYAGTEIIVFRESNPLATTVVAGNVAGKLCANSSWTDDGKLIFIQQDDPTNPDWTRLKRASFSTVPTVSTITTVTTPSVLISPTDPHQIGPSDATGRIAFPARFQHPNGWMAPIWIMSAAGTTNAADLALGGCPLCATGCCAWPTMGEILGTADPHFDHAGTALSWMQQHPDVAFGSPPEHPFRQVARSLPSGPQLDLTPVGIDPTTSLTFGQWRDDDAELVYWSIELELGVVRQNLYRMMPDGSARQKIVIPHELCPTHPSYVTSSAIVFSAWRCGGVECSCQVAKL